MGLSPDHASTVPLVLNLDTGTITPQFHVIFDDWFTTVATSVDNLPDFTSSVWSKMFGDSEYQLIRDEDDTQVVSEDSMCQETLPTGKTEYQRLWTLPCLPHPCHYLHLCLHLPHLPTLHPVYHLPHVSQLTSHCCVLTFNWCLCSSSALEGENTFASATATEGALKN